MTGFVIERNAEAAGSQGRPALPAQDEAHASTPGRTMRDIIWALEACGWVWVKSRGSHRQYRHAIRPGRISISGHAPGELLDQRTLAALLEQAGSELGPQ